ncbi:MAG: hypothetical protein K2K79_06475 [Paramuribaculum sp.]|nr:hypothetical protein [Paramuribaculum sp.]
MMQQCPQCGAWAEANKRSILDNATDGVNAVADLGGDIVGGVLGVFGKSAKKLGRGLGKATSIVLGGVGGAIGGAIGGALGSSYVFECPACGHSWECDNEDEDQTKEYEHLTAILATRAQLVDNIWTDNPDKTALRKYILDVDEKISNEEVADYRSYLYDWKSIAHWLLHEYNEAYQSVSESLRIQTDPHSRAMRGLYLTELLHLQPSPIGYIDALRDLTSIYDNDHKFINFPEPFFEEKIKNSILKYTESFISIPPTKRRFICFTDELRSMGNNILVLPLGRVPSGLYFSDGLPKQNAIYELHPFKADHYVRLDTFDIDILNDKIKEFTWILENLGAKEIKLSIENLRSQEENRNTELGFNGELGHKAASVKGDYKQNSAMDKFNKLKTYLNENSSFYPGPTPPQLPPLEKLIWYHHTEDWQRKVESRLSGRAKEFSISFNTHSSYSLTESQSKELEVEMKTIIARGKGGGNNSTEYHIQQTENSKWNLEIEFYPLSTYQKVSNDKSIISDISNSLSAEEQKYLKTYRDCISNGSISENERKLLDMLGANSGLSSSRMSELEAMVNVPKKKSFISKILSFFGL